MTAINSTYHGWKPSVHPQTVHDHLSSFLGRPRKNLARDIIFCSSANSINTRKHGAFCYIESIGDRCYRFLVSEQPQCYQQELSYRYRLSTPALWARWNFWTVAKVLDKLFKGFRRKTKMTGKLTNCNEARLSPGIPQCAWLFFALRYTGHGHKTVIAILPEYLPPL